MKRKNEGWTSGKNIENESGKQNANEGWTSSKIIINDTTPKEKIDIDLDKE